MKKEKETTLLALGSWIFLRKTDMETKKRLAH